MDIQEKGRVGGIGCQDNFLTWGSQGDYLHATTIKCVLFLLMYVDDILMSSSSKDKIGMPKEKLNLEFQMKDLSIMKRILGVDIVRNRKKGNCSYHNILDLAHAISIVSQFMANLSQAHWEALKWVLRYFNGSLKFCLGYKKTTQGGNVIVRYVDTNYTGNVDTRKLLFDYMFTSFGATICWKESLQPMVVLPTTQAKYNTHMEGVHEVI
ncbi:hypothetical protein CR513_14285, partial [Mucuna pruriens]